MDNEALPRLVDRKVAVRLKNVEAGGVEIIATLDEVRDDGVVLREVGELGPGPTIFCPWDALHTLRERPPWLAPPHEEPEEEPPEGPWPGESYYTRAPEPPERRREPSAQTLERVVPLAQKRTVGDVTVALSSLELHAEGLGVLHRRVSLGEGALLAQPDFAREIPEPFFEIRDDAGHVLPWSPSGSAASVGESHGEVEVRDLPGSAELEVRVVRLAAGVYESDGDHLGEGACVEGPWVFRFTL